MHLSSFVKQECTYPVLSYKFKWHLKNFYDEIRYILYYETIPDKCPTFYEMLYDKTGYHTFSSQKQYNCYQLLAPLYSWQQGDSNGISH